MAPADLKAAWAEAPVILDVGGTTDGYIIPPSGGGGLKFGSGLHKVRTSDADWNREPVEGEGEAIRNLFAPPMTRIGEYGVTSVVTCAYTFTEDERFTAAEFGKCLVVSACSGHLSSRSLTPSPSLSRVGQPSGLPPPASLGHRSATPTTPS